MPNQFICKIASLEDMERRWADEIARHREDRDNWLVWKEQTLEQYRQGEIIPYYGFLDGVPICEATAKLRPSGAQNSDGLVGDKRVYLCAFRTVKEYRGRGYFSKLMSFLLEDLARRGYEMATLGVEPTETVNKQIYAHYGFTRYIKSATETYPDGTTIEVEYYGKLLTPDP